MSSDIVTTFLVANRICGDSFAPEDDTNDANTVEQDDEGNDVYYHSDTVVDFEEIDRSDDEVFGFFIHGTMEEFERTCTSSDMKSLLEIYGITPREFPTFAEFPNSGLDDGDVERLADDVRKYFIGEGLTCEEIGTYRLKDVIPRLTATQTVFTDE